MPNGATRVGATAAGRPERSVPPSWAQRVHGGGPGPLGRAPGAGVPDLGAELAAAEVAGRAGPGLPVAGEERVAALRLRAGDARGAVRVARRVHRPGPDLVDG